MRRGGAMNGAITADKARSDAADARLAATPALWAYLPWILAYPLRGHALAVLLMIVLFVRLGSQNMMGIPLLAIIAIWSLHYLLNVIARSAAGRALPPPMSANVVFLDAAKTFKSLLLPALVISAAAALERHGQRHGAVAVLTLGAFVLPAYFLLLAFSDKLFTAINPLQWLQVIAVTGLPYLASCGLLALAVSAWLWLSSALGLTLIVAAGVYLTLMIGHLLGTVAYHRHERLGIDVEVHHPEEQRREQDAKDKLAGLLLRIEHSLRRNDAEGAERTLLAEQDDSGNPRLFHELLFERLLALGDARLIHAQGRRLLSLLLREKRSPRALEVYEICCDRHPRFEPASAQELAALATTALSLDYHELFAQLLADLQARYASDPAITAVLLEQAHYLCERKHDDAAALAILRPLLQQSQHPLHAKIASLARALGGA
jgi:hypothetical protein